MATSTRPPQNVMPRRIVDQVGHESFGECRVTRYRRSLKPGRKMKAATVEVSLPTGEHPGGHVRQVERFAVTEPSFASRKREERCDESLLLLVRREGALAGCAPPTRCLVGIEQSRLQQCVLQRQWCPQLVRRVGDELPLRLEGPVEPCDQCIERVPELLQFVVGPRQRQALMQVVCGDVASRRRDGPQRTQRSAGHQPTEPDRHDRHDGQRDQRLHEQLMRVTCVLVLGLRDQLLHLLRCFRAVRRR